MCTSSSAGTVSAPCGFDFARRLGIARNGIASPGWALTVLLGVLAFMEQRPGQATAGVVVLVNKTEGQVEVEISDGDSRAGGAVLPAGGLVPIITTAPPTVRIKGSAAPITERLALNSIYQIESAKGPDLTLREIRVGNLRPGIWQLPPGKNINRAVVVPVAVYVDEEQPALREVWEPRLRRQVEEASRFVEWFCQVRFEVVAVGTWQSDNAAHSVEALLADFRRKVSPGPARLAIGFSSQLRVTENAAFHCPLGLLESHVVIPDVQQHFSSQAQLMSLIHSFGHFLGAVDMAEGPSVMNPGHNPPEVDKNRRDYFDPLNTLLINLVAEELAFRNVRHPRELSSSTRNYLVGVYRPLTYRSRRPNMERLLAGFEESPAKYERFVAAWRDGSLLSGPEILNWGDSNDEPELAGKRLFDRQASIRWILDAHAQPPQTPESYVEFLAGDRLPGRVVAGRPAEIVDEEFVPARLEVAPYTRVDWPEFRVRDRIPVLAAWVKRVVWKARSSEFQPGTAFLEDGRRIVFQALQWMGTEVKLLTESGIRSVTLDELAEIHLPGTDPWEEVLGSRVSLIESPADTVMEIECSDGLRLTTCLTRLVPRARGDKKLPESWFHMVQPGWSLQPLWIPHRSVVWRRFYAFNEIPLTDIRCEYRETAKFGGKWGYRVNANLLGGSLQTGGRLYGWGFGVPSGSEVIFPLHPLVTTVRLGLGLDSESGDGGCIRGEGRLLTGAGELLFRSPLLIGSATVFDPGEIHPPRNDAQNVQLLLRVDEAEEERPAGADPWNVRDLADWVEPLCILDGQSLDAELRRRRFSLIPCWEGWRIVAPEEDATRGPRVTVALDQSIWDAPRFRIYHVFRGEFALERTLSLSPTTRTLEVSICRPQGVPPYRVEIFADGQSLASATVPERGGPNPPTPVTADLSGLAGRAVKLRILLRAENSDSDLKAEWRFIRLVRDRQAPPAP